MASWPPTVITPSVGSIMRLTMRRVVVFPQPEGPTKTATLPSGTSRLRSSTAVVPSGKRLLTLSNVIKESPALLPMSRGTLHLPRRPFTWPRIHTGLSGCRWGSSSVTRKEANSE